jgi:type IV secretory pathway VirJ component
VLIGYSFGACVAPFIANNFSSSLKKDLKSVYCISPDETCDFEVHISDMLNFNSKEKYDVLNELKKIASLKPICIFGKGENTTLLKHFSIPEIKVETLPGNHHFNRDFNALALIVVKSF